MYDFHTHSTYSDGTFTPQELVDYAKAQGIKILSLTDHDSIDGVAPCIDYGAKNGLIIVPGVELSVNWHHKVIHLVALDVDLSDESLISLLKNQQNIRLNRAKMIAQQLSDAIGLEAGLEKALQFAKGGLVARPHFAQVLIKEGFCRDMKTAFSQYLKRGRCGYVRTNWVDLKTGLQTLIEAKGIPVLAHPKKYQFTRTKLHELLTDFKQYGGQAMEVISGTASRDEISHLKALSIKFDLLASRGSDFHGEKITPNVMKYLADLPPECNALIDSPLMEKYQ